MNNYQISRSRQQRQLAVLMLALCWGIIIVD
ncbi:hypothetical protein BH18ACI2_BH18ACI2_29550 [soil metagenome]